jgi:hypothetical protein
VSDSTNVKGIIDGYSPSIMGVVSTLSAPEDSMPLVPWLLGCSCVLGAPGDNSVANKGANPRFLLNAEILEVLEGGPFLVRVTLEYKGDKDIRVSRANWRKNSEIVPRAPWKSRPVNFLTAGWLYGNIQVSPGERFSELHYVHHAWETIPSGTVELDVKWPIYAPGGADAPGKEIACPMTRLKVEIPGATKEGVRALCRRLEDKANKFELSRSEIYEYLHNTKHPELALLAWRLIEDAYCPYPIHDFLPLVYDGEANKSAVNRRLVKLACNPKCTRALTFFHYWYRERIEFSADELEPLHQSENIWLRVMTCAIFPGQCGKGWKARLLQDLRSRYGSVPVKQFAKFLADLDSETFAVREKATQELQAHGERVWAGVAEALQGKLTPEVRRRLQIVLEAIPHPEPPPIVHPALRVLAKVETPEARAILRLLAEEAGNPSVKELAASFLHGPPPLRQGESHQRDSR